MKKFEKPSFKVATYDVTNNYGHFVIEPLERGFGTTLGNALRRVLLSSLPGASVYAIEVEGARHEFSSLEGVEEDVTSIVLSLKDLVLKIDAEEEGNKRLEEAFNNKTVLKAKVAEVVKGGLKVIVDDVAVFIPASLTSFIPSIASFLTISLRYSISSSIFFISLFVNSLNNLHTPFIHYAMFQIIIDYIEHKHNCQLKKLKKV